MRSDLRSEVDHVTTIHDVVALARHDYSLYYTAVQQDKPCAWHDQGHECISPIIIKSIYLYRQCGELSPKISRLKKVSFALSPARPLACSRAMTARILSGRSGWGAEDCSACMVMRSSKANPVRLGGGRALCSPNLGAVLKSASSFTASWPQSCRHLLIESQFYTMDTFTSPIRQPRFTKDSSLC